MPLQEEFRLRLRELFAAEGRYYSELIERLKVDLDAAILAEKGLAGKVAEHETAFREATENARTAEELLASVRREHADNALERDRADREHRYQSEQIVELNNRLEVLRMENLAVEERIKLIDSEVDRLKVDEQKETAAADASASELEIAEQQWAEKVEAVRRVEERLETARATLTRHTAAIERFDELRQQLTINAERLSERRKGLENERERAEQSITEHQDEASRLEREIAAEKEKLSGLDTEKVQVVAAVSEAREKLRGSEEVLRSFNEEHSRKKHRHETLHELEESRAVYFPQIQKLFTEQEKLGVAPIGVLADFLKVDEEAETAVELLFGPYLQTVLVESDSDADKVAAWVRENRIGRVSTLVLGRADVLGGGTAGHDGTLGGMIGASADLVRALQSVFPREMSAVLVDDIRKNTTGDGKILIDASGEMSVGSRLFVSGAMETDEKNASLLAFKRELAGSGPGGRIARKEDSDCRE